MLVFLDACVIIYWVEANEFFYTSLVNKLGKIAEKHPDHLLCISRLSFLECLVKPLKENNQTALTIYEQFFNAPGLSIIEINAEVIDHATQLRARHNLRTPDAIQAASCLVHKEEHLFLTNDRRFTQVDDLCVVHL